MTGSACGVIVMFCQFMEASKEGENSYAVVCRCDHDCVSFHRRCAAVLAQQWHTDLLRAHSGDTGGGRILSGVFWSIQCHSKSPSYPVMSSELGLPPRVVRHIK